MAFHGSLSFPIDQNVFNNNNNNAASQQQQQQQQQQEMVSPSSSCPLLPNNLFSIFHHRTWLIVINIAVLCSVLVFSTMGFILSARSVDAVGALSIRIAALPDFRDVLSTINDGQASIELSAYDTQKHAQETLDVLLIFVELFQNLTAAVRG